MQRIGKIIRGFPIGVGGDILQPKRPVVTQAIILINVVVYLITTISTGFISISNKWLELGGYIPVLVLSEPSNIYRVFTSMFLHANPLHIFFNMYFLYVFGRGVENILGRWRYLLLYLGSGVLATIFHTAFGYLQGPGSLTIPAIGASGAISGILGAYMLLYPGTRLSACFWFFLIPLCFTTRAAYYLLFWFALQVLYGYSSTGATVAFFAHAGGFVAGIAILYAVADKKLIGMLRDSLTTGIQSLFGIIWFREYVRPRGLKKVTKTLFSLLTLAILVGALTAYVEAYWEKPVVTVVDLETTYEGVHSESYITILHDKALKPEGLEYAPDIARVVFNRLWNTGLLYNPDYAGETITFQDRVLNALIPACNTYVPVPVRISDFKATYDENGFMISGSGVLSSRVVSIGYTARGACVYNLGEPFTAGFKASTAPGLGLDNLVSSTSFISLVTTILALYIVLKKDADLVIVS